MRISDWSSDVCSSDLRGESSDAGFMGAAKAILGTALPVVPLTAVTGGGFRLLWVRPDGWRICGTPDVIAALEERLRPALERQSVEMGMSVYDSVGSGGRRDIRKKRTKNIEKMK